jgi:hypothetical protein
MHNPFSTTQRPCDDLLARLFGAPLFPYASQFSAISAAFIDIYHVFALFPIIADWESAGIASSERSFNTLALYGNCSARMRAKTAQHIVPEIAGKCPGLDFSADSRAKAMAPPHPKTGPLMRPLLKSGAMGESW